MIGDYVLLREPSRLEGGRHVPRSKERNDMTTRQTGFINVFIGKGNYRYPSAIVHKTRSAAENAQKNETEGNPVYIAEITWDEPDGIPWNP
jgi:hypothetical protein